MKFIDQGIIISIKKYSENSLIVKVFSQNHGIYSSFVKSAKSNKDRLNFQIGNLISFEYRSRLEENLGQFYAIDLVACYCSRIMFDKLKLDCVKSLFAIIEGCFLEREEHKRLFDDLNDFLQKITDENIEKKEFLASYIKLELKILETLGYGIDFSCCVVTNSSENLAFVSPKSAHAVSFEAGKSYEKKLLKLPSFLISETSFDENHLFDGLKLSGYFLEKFIFEEKRESEKKQHSFYRENIIKSLNIGN